MRLYWYFQLFYFAVFKIPLSEESTEHALNRTQDELHKKHQAWYVVHKLCKPEQYKFFSKSTAHVSPEKDGGCTTVVGT